MNLIPGKKKGLINEYNINTVHGNFAAWQSHYIGGIRMLILSNYRNYSDRRKGT